MADAESRNTRGVYAISVAAVLAGTGQQNLRVYERKGLLMPARTSGGTRQYSEENIATLRRIGELLDAGLNLAGIRMVLELEADNSQLRDDAEKLREDAEQLREDAQQLREDATRLRKESRRGR